MKSSMRLMRLMKERKIQQKKMKTSTMVLKNMQMIPPRPKKRLSYLSDYVKGQESEEEKEKLHNLVVFCRSG